MAKKKIGVGTFIAQVVRGWVWKLDARVIHHKAQRYETVGDYWEGKHGEMHFRVSKMSKLVFSMLVLIHELIEWILCKTRKISNKSIDAFDKKFEEERKAGKHGQFDEPGDDPRAPYHREHQFATKIEKLLAQELGVDWKEYEREVQSLSQD